MLIKSEICVLTNVKEPLLTFFDALRDLKGISLSGPKVKWYLFNCAVNKGYDMITKYGNKRYDYRMRKLKDKL
jgi:hypothetical protein